MVWKLLISCNSAQTNQWSSQKQYSLFLGLCTVHLCQEAQKGTQTGENSRAWTLSLFSWPSRFPHHAFRCPRSPLVEGTPSRGSKLQSVPCEFIDQRAGLHDSWSVWFRGLLLRKTGARCVCSYPNKGLQSLVETTAFRPLLALSSNKLWNGLLI